MPAFLPLVIGALVGGAVVKLVKTALRNEDARHGYCSWCGRRAKHRFVEDGVSWLKAAPLAILTGGLGTAVASLVSRNVFRCDSCGKQTLPCRMPGCGSMARSSRLYDDEFCGQCSGMNNADAERARRERSEAENNKLVELLRLHEERISMTEQAIRHESDASRVAALLEVIARQKQELAVLRHRLGLPEEAGS